MGRGHGSCRGGGRSLGVRNLARVVEDTYRTEGVTEHN